MKNQTKLKQYLKLKYLKDFSNKKKKSISQVMYTKFGFPFDVSSDFLTLRKPLTAATDFELFTLLYGTDKNELGRYFTDDEISKYMKQDFKMEMMPDSFEFPALEIVPNQQWISRISTKELIQLRDNQMINYNEKTQRNMRYVTYGGVKHYEITVNNKAVESIMKLMQAGVYIPNTLTFNIPEDAEFSYNRRTRVLNFDKISMFDILDGYHRYIAISKCYTLDKNFEYPMELRFVQFRESKANQFIFQEDQKTKMRKIDSDSFNQFDYANQVVQKLNDDSNLAGLINKNNGIINSAMMAYLINTIYFKKRDSATTNRTNVIIISKDLKEKINEITERNVELLTKPWDDKFLFLFLLASREYDDMEVIEKKIKLFYDEINMDSFRNKKIPAKTVASIAKMMKGGE